MAKFKLVAVVLLMCFVCCMLPESAMAVVTNGTTADLFKLYGIKSVPSVEEEKQALEDISGEYSKVAAVVIGQDMINTATDQFLGQYQELLESYDRDIYALQNDVDLAGLILENSGEEPVSVILKRDADYRVLQSQLNNKIDARVTLVNQLSTAKPEAVDVNPERAQLVQLQQDMTNKKEDVARAMAYSKLGQVGLNKYPVGEPTRVTSVFGWRLDPVGQTEMMFHSGMDLKASIGTQVLAAFNGTVEKVIISESGGHMVYLNHGDGIRSVYMHLSEFLVAEGDVVKQYQPIALSGNTGSRTTGPHLHFGLYIGDMAVDPSLLYN